MKQERANQGTDDSQYESNTDTSQKVDDAIPHWNRIGRRRAEL